MFIDGPLEHKGRLDPGRYFWHFTESAVKGGGLFVIFCKIYTQSYKNTFASALIAKGEGDYPLFGFGQDR